MRNVRFELVSDISNEDRQLPDPEITSPKSCQVLPSNFINCICLIGAKSSALVETVMPGSSIGSLRSWILSHTPFTPPIVSPVITITVKTGEDQQ